MQRGTIITSAPPKPAVAVDHDGRPSRGWLVALSFALAGLVLAWRNIRDGIWVDLGVYLMGGQAVLDGTPIYEQVYATLNGNLGIGLPFTYPVFAAVLFAPLAALPLQAAHVVFTVGTLACLVLAVEVVRRRLRLGILPAIPVYVLAFALEPFIRTVLLGQVNAYLIALIVLDCLVVPKRYRGILTGIAAGVKLTPLAFLILPVVRRDVGWGARLLLSFAGTAVFGALVRPQDSWFYWSGGAGDLNRFGRAAVVGVDNQGMTAGVSRVLGWDFPPTWLALVVLVVVMAGTAVVTWRRVSLGDDVGAMVAVALGSVLASPIAWSHHWLWIVMFLLWAVAYRRRVMASVTALVFWLAPFWSVFRWPMALGPYDATGRILGLTYVVTGVAALVVLWRAPNVEPPAQRVWVPITSHVPRLRPPGSVRREPGTDQA